jgi:hypothetical protein
MRPENSTRAASTIFNQEIAQLENRRTVIETEREKLLRGQIKVTGTDGT